MKGNRNLQHSLGAGEPIYFFGKKNSLARKAKLFFNFVVIFGLVLNTVSPAFAAAASQPSVANFSYGVLAVNTDQSAYEPGQSVFVQMGSLDSKGHTLCNSNLELDVVSGDTIVKKFSTADGSIQHSQSCGHDNVTDNPDYTVRFPAGAVGDYELILKNVDTGLQVNNLFTVENNLPFTIQRQTATRINPFKSTYQVHLTISATQDFDGLASDYVQGNFLLTNSGGASVTTAHDNSGTSWQQLSWPISVKAGENVTLSYEYQAPLSSPDYFKLGFLQLRAKTINQLLNNLPATSSNAIVYQETRPWEIASDITTTAKASGLWSAAGTWTNGIPSTTSDTAQIGGAFTVTVDNNFTIGNLVFLATSSNASATITPGVTLTVNSTTTIQSSTTNAAINRASITGGGTFSTANLTIGNLTSPGTGVVCTTSASSTVNTFNVTNNVLFVAGTASSGRAQKPVFYLESGTMTITGKVFFNTNTNGIAQFYMNTGAQSGTLSLSSGGTTFQTGGSTATALGTFGLNGTSSVVKYTGAAPNIATTTYTTLTLNGTGTSTLIGGAATAATLNVSSGELDSNNQNLTVNGTTTISSASFLGVTAGTSGTITFNDIEINSGGTFKNTAGDAVTITGNIVNNGTFTGGSGTYTLQTNDLAISGSGTTAFGGAVTVTGITVTNNGTVTIGSSFTGTGSWTQGVGSSLTVGGATTNAIGISGTFSATAANNTVTYSTTTVAQTIDASNYYNLTITGSRGANSVTFQSSGTVGIAGTLTNSATFSSGTYVFTGSTVSYTGTADQTILSLNSVNYNNLTYAGSANGNLGANVGVSGSLTISSGNINTNGKNLTVSGATSISGTLTFSSGVGTFSFADVTINNGGTWINSVNGGVTISGSFTNNGTFTSGSGTYTLSGTTKNITGTATFTSVSITGSLTATDSATITITSSLNISSSGSLNAGTKSFVFTSSGSPLVNSGTFTASTSLVSFQATTSTTSIPSLTYYNLDFSPSTGTPEFRFATSTLTVNNNLTSNGVGNETLNAYASNTPIAVSGNVTIGSGDSFLAPSSSSFTISGSFTNNGTFTHENGTLTFNTSGTTATVSAGNSSFYNLTMSGSGTLTNVGTTTIAGILSVPSAAATTTIFLTSPTSTNQTWTVPSDWNSSNNTIEVIGGGGGGGGGDSSGEGGDGGGGGAYAKISNLTLTPGGSVTYQIGAGGTTTLASAGTNGGDTWFNGTTLSGSSVGAKGGSGAPNCSGTVGGAGGATSTSVGTIKYAGGTGGSTSFSACSVGGFGAGAGGGSAGPNGNGANGGSPAAAASNDGNGGGGNGGGSAGGNASASAAANGGNNSSGTGGGAAGAPGGAGTAGGGGGGATGGSATQANNNGGAGGNGTEWDSSHGSGGGGGSAAPQSGGSNTNGGKGGNGGLYGGGGAGGYDITGGGGGTGGQGIIVIKYVPIGGGTFNAGTSTLIFTGTGTPLSVATSTGFVASTSLVSFQATSGTTSVPSLTYYNLDFSPSTGNPEFRLATSTIIINNNLTTGGNGNPMVNAYASNTPVTISGSLTIGSGDSFLAPSSSSFTISNNFTNNGTFTHESGTITIGTSSGTSLISGTSTTFNNFVATGTSVTIKFQAQSSNLPVFTFAGTLGATGTAGNLITIQSSVASTQWLAKFNSAQAGITYANIKDSGCASGSSTVTASNSTSGGNNGTCWNIVVASSVSSGGGGGSSGTPAVDNGSGTGSLIIGGSAGGSSASSTPSTNGGGGSGSVQTGGGSGGGGGSAAP